MNPFVLIVAACLFASPTIAQDKASIQKLNDAFEAAFARGDAAALAGMYTDDASDNCPGKASCLSQKLREQSSRSSR